MWFLLLLLVASYRYFTRFVLISAINLILTLLYTSHSNMTTKDPSEFRSSDNKGILAECRKYIFSFLAAEELRKTCNNHNSSFIDIMLLLNHHRLIDGW